MNARRTTNHPVARTYLSTETLVFGWISRDCDSFQELQLLRDYGSGQAERFLGAC